MNAHTYSRVELAKSEALGALRKGHPEAAAKLLHRAIGMTPPGESVASLVKAMEACKSDSPSQAICLLDGHNYIGGATCYHCGTPLTTHSVAGLLTSKEKAQLKGMADNQLIALADLAVITERCLKIGNPEREKAITKVVRNELASRGIVAPGEPS